MDVIQPRHALLATLASGALAFLWWRSSRSQSREEEEEDWEPIDRDHVVKFFQIINAQSQAQAASFNQQVAQYRGKIEEQQLTDLGINHFEEQLFKNQKQILAGMGISLEDMEDATAYYEQEGDPLVKEQVTMLKNLYLAVSKSKSVDMPGLPDDLTAEKMVTVVSAFFKASNDCIREVVEDLIAQARFCPTDPATAREMSVLLQQRNGPATDAAIKRFNLDSNTIGPAMEKFQDHAEIQNAIRAGAQQQREM
ncbi:unnamed protein product [Ascophyllum nodosum]